MAVTPSRSPQISIAVKSAFIVCLAGLACRIECINCVWRLCNIVVRDFPNLNKSGMVALCEEMGQVEGSFPPMNLKLILLNPISNPMKSHVYRF